MPMMIVPPWVFAKAVTVSSSQEESSSRSLNSRIFDSIDSYRMASSVSATVENYPILSGTLPTGWEFQGSLHVMTTEMDKGGSLSRIFARSTILASVAGSSLTPCAQAHTTMHVTRQVYLPAVSSIQVGSVSDPATAV
jgi:hypothetical protein